MSIETQNYFKDNKYVVIRNHIDPNIALLLYQYCKNKARSADIRYTYDRSTYSKEWDGEWEDRQTPGAYSLYGDPIMDSLLELSTSAMEDYTGLKLNPNYSYWRLYQKGHDLKRHIDRYSCEISATLCLGYDNSNVDTSVYPNYNWGMYVKEMDGNELPIALNPGDMIVYRGAEVEHWREPFLGLNQAQVFIHYNQSSTENIYDGRPFVGIPKRFTR